MRELLIKQLSNFFFLDNKEAKNIEQLYPLVEQETIECLSKINNKYYTNIKNTGLNPLHSNSWTILLYKMSRYLFLNNKIETASKVYYLNKILHSVELYYEVELPKYFSLDHPLGSVIGRAKIGEYFSFSQGCTVGNNKGIYPVIGNNVAMMSNSKIIGESVVGNNCIISANTYIKDRKIPDNTIVFGRERGELIFVPNKIKNHLWNV